MLILSRLLMMAVFLLAACGLMDVANAQKFPQVAQTPPMGWNSWNKFGCNINEQLMREMADAMITTGMKDAGYQYLNIDDCWQGVRDANGFIQPDPQRFPSGIKALADYVHGKGLKLGIYSDAGNKTCGGYHGSRGHEYQDAITYANWGIDYLKYDWCDTKGMVAEVAYTTMRDALNTAGHPVVFSICEWGDNKPWEWAGNIGHSWRTTGDIYPCWDCEVSHGTWSSWGVLRILDKQAGLRKYSGAGHWNDMDMLEVGNGLTETEERAHFSLWAMMNSPLISGNDLRSMSESTRKTLTNKDIIALNQDALGIQAIRYMGGTKIETYVKPLAGGEWAVLFLNRGDEPAVYEFNWQAQSFEDDLNKLKVNFGKASYQWKNLWTGITGTTAKNFRQSIPAHDVVVLRLKPAA